MDHCDNRRLIAEIDRYDSLGEAMHNLLEQNLIWHEESLISLIDLVDAVKQRRAKDAAAAMGRHMAIIADLVKTGMFKVDGESAAQ